MPSHKGFLFFIIIISWTLTFLLHSSECYHSHTIFSKYSFPPIVISHYFIILILNPHHCSQGPFLHTSKTISLFPSKPLCNFSAIFQSHHSLLSLTVSLEAREMHKNMISLNNPAHTMGVNWFVRRIKQLCLV